MPKVSIVGSRRFSSRRTSAACKSPEASPAMMASFMVSVSQIESPSPRGERGEGDTKRSEVQVRGVATCAALSKPPHPPSAPSPPAEKRWGRRTLDKSFRIVSPSRNVRPKLPQRKRIHQPRQRDPAEKEREEDEKEEADPLGPRLFPEKREENAGGDGVDEHQHDVVSEEAHSFRPCAMSKTSSMRRRFISAAVIVNAVPCSNVIELTSACTPMPTAIQYRSPAPIDPRLARIRRRAPPLCSIV